MVLKLYNSALSLLFSSFPAHFLFQAHANPFFFFSLPPPYSAFPHSQVRSPFLAFPSFPSRVPQSNKSCANAHIGRWNGNCGDEKKVCPIKCALVYECKWKRARRTRYLRHERDMGYSFRVWGGGKTMYH